MTTLLKLGLLPVGIGDQHTSLVFDTQDSAAGPNFRLAEVRKKVVLYHMYAMRFEVRRDAFQHIGVARMTQVVGGNLSRVDFRSRAAFAQLCRNPKAEKMVATESDSSYQCRRNFLFSVHGTLTSNRTIIHRAVTSLATQPNLV